MIVRLCWQYCWKHGPASSAKMTFAADFVWSPMTWCLDTKKGFTSLSTVIGKTNMFYSRKQQDFTRLTISTWRQDSPTSQRSTSRSLPKFERHCLNSTKLICRSSFHGINNYCEETWHRNSWCPRPQYFSLMSSKDKVLSITLIRLECYGF